MGCKCSHALAAFQPSSHLEELERQDFVMHKWLSTRKVVLLKRNASLVVCRIHAKASDAHRERRILATLATSEYVPRLVKCSHAPSKCVLYDYTPGIDFHHYLSHTPCSCNHALLEQLFAAVQFCHFKHIVHLDLKPANIILTQDGRVQLIDFEYAMRMPYRTTMTHTTSTRGTLGFVSPDVYNHSKVGYAADIWSLGCILIVWYTRHSVTPTSQQAADLLLSEEEIPIDAERVPRDILPLIRSMVSYNYRQRPTIQHLISKWKHSLLNV